MYVQTVIQRNKCYYPYATCASGVAQNSLKNAHTEVNFKDTLTLFSNPSIFTKIHQEISIDMKGF